MKVTVELRKHENAVHAPEFERGYELDEFERDLAVNEINEAIKDYEQHLNLNGISINDLSDWEQEDIENLKQLKPDVYQINCGDYTYWIRIEENSINKVFEEINQKYLIGGENEKYATLYNDKQGIINEIDRDRKSTRLN